MGSIIKKDRLKMAASFDQLKQVFCQGVVYYKEVMVGEPKVENKKLWVLSTGWKPDGRRLCLSYAPCRRVDGYGEYY